MALLILVLFVPEFIYMYERYFGKYHSEKISKNIQKVLDNNSNVRYNPKGELLTIEDRVKEFLDTNPHFRNVTVQGSGSKASIGGNTVKPFKIQDLDMSKEEDRKRYAEYRKQRDSRPTQINLNNK